MNTIKELFVRMIHPGPISTMVLIKTITLSVIYCSLMWWPVDSVGGLLCLTSFLMSSGLVMYNFFSAMTVGPGYLPKGWKPKNPEDCEKLQFCNVCEGYKAPRAHHCRKCGRCCLKLDHHCPWINNCVGHANHVHFVLFLFFAWLGCTQGGIILSCSLYRAMFRAYYVYYKENVPIVYLGPYGIIWVLFSIGCSVGVSLGVGVLLYYQLKTVVRNQTGIEDWIVEKAQYRRQRNPKLPPFIYPYNFGFKQNFKLFLRATYESYEDGINWPVVDNCDQFTITIEQLQQKHDKRKRAKEYVIIEDYSGSWCPVSKGICVFCRPPMSDESRIPLKKDDRINVTRWKKYWLYGEVLEKHDELHRVHQTKTNDHVEQKTTSIKGWFPRRCAIECINSSNRSDDSEEEEEKTSPVIPPKSRSKQEQVESKKKK